MRRAPNAITITVHQDRSDPQNVGWAWRQYDSMDQNPKRHCELRSDWVLVESGPVRGRQTSVRPSRSRILHSVGWHGPLVRVIFA